MTPQKAEFQAIDYFEKFHCIGNKCPSNCCNSWKILVDTKTAEKYREADALKGDGYFSPITADGKQSIIALKSDGVCPFLEEDKLCGIVKRYGPEMLCRTCQIYPRIGRYIAHNGSQQVYGALSCPHVVSLALFRRKKLQFLSIPASASNNFSIEHRLPNAEQRSPIHNATLESIHKKCVGLIQKQHVTLQQRQTALLLLCSLAEKLPVLEEAEAALRFENEITAMSAVGIHDLPRFAPNLGHQFKLFVTLIESLVSFKNNANDSPGRKQLFAIINVSFAALGISSFREIRPEHGENYEQSQIRHIKPLLEGKPHILENLSAHFLMCSDFPFNRGQRPLFNYLYFAVLQLFIRGLLGGYGQARGGLSDGDIVHVIHTIFREIEHNPQSAQNINNFAAMFNAQGIGDIHTMTAL